MTVVPHGDGTGMFEVSSSSGNTYTVDLAEGRCTCPDAQYNLDDDERCKHERRCRLMLGIQDVPVALIDDIDVCLRRNMEKFGTEPETITVPSDTGQTVAMADGGQTFTTHREPVDQGGKKYVRCEGCGRELLTELGGREKLAHPEDCPKEE